MTQNTGRTITQVLRDAIIANNNSYSGLAALSGVDKGQIARFMKGTRDLTLGTADKLAAALGLCFSPSLTLSPEGDESAIDGDLATVNTSGKIPKTGVVPGIIIESKKRSPKGIGKKQAE
jgi:transcriptional regulator with XRE-family HTH domain